MAKDVIQVYLQMDMVLIWYVSPLDYYFDLPLHSFLVSLTLHILLSRVVVRKILSMGQVLLPGEDMRSLV